MGFGQYGDGEGEGGVVLCFWFRGRLPTFWMEARRRKICDVKIYISAIACWGDSEVQCLFLASGMECDQFVGALEGT